MRKTVALILLVFTGFSYGNWSLISEEDYYSTITKTQFIDPQHGWIIRDQTNSPLNGRLEYSNDSGKTWSPVSQTGMDMVRGIHEFYFINRNVGWAGGCSRDADYSEHRVIYKTIDGGENWNLVLSDSSTYINVRKVIFPTTSVGYVFSQNFNNNSRSFTIDKTKDGGVNWTTELINEDIVFTNAFFINADTGWVIGTTLTLPGKILKTVDGGNTWESKPYNLQHTEGMGSVFFIDNQRGWVAGGNVRCIIHTTDGGDSWQVQSGCSNLISGFVLTDIYFVNDSVGWTIGNSAGSTAYLSYTTNGGKNWEHYSEYIEQFIYSDQLRIHFVGQHHGWITGGRNTIIRTTNGGGLSEYLTSVNPQLRQRQSQTPSAFNMRISPAKSGISNISYTLNTESMLSISVYNLKGKKIASKPNSLRSAGEHSFSFKAPKGFYIVEAKVQDKSGMGERDAKHRVFTERVLVR